MKANLVFTLRLSCFSKTKRIQGGFTPPGRTILCMPLRIFLIYNEGSGNSFKLLIFKVRIPKSVAINFKIVSTSFLFENTIHFSDYSPYTTTWGFLKTGILCNSSIFHFSLWIITWVFLLENSTSIFGRSFYSSYIFEKHFSLQSVFIFNWKFTKVLNPILFVNAR